MNKDLELHFTDRSCYQAIDHSIIAMGTL